MAGIVVEPERAWVRAVRFIVDNGNVA